MSFLVASATVELAPYKPRANLQFAIPMARLYIQEIDNRCLEFVPIVGPVTVDFPTETADPLPVSPAPIVDSCVRPREFIVGPAMDRSNDLAAGCLDRAHFGLLLELAY